MLGQSRLLHWLGSESEERSLVRRAICFAMLIGAAQAFISIVPLSIFLTAYNSSLLTYVYMSMGIITYLIGNFFKYLQNRLSFFQFLTAPLIIFSISLLLCWGLLIGTNFNWYPMAFFIWSSVAYTFLSLVLSTLLVRIFTLQEGKKYFGIIGGTRALGGIVSGFLTPLLVNQIGTKNVFLLAPFFILIGITALFSIRKYHSDRFAEEKHHEKSKRESVSFKKMQNRGYVLCLFIIAIVSVFNFYSLDLLFNTEVKKHFLSQAEITGFLGVFLALSNTLVLIGGFFVFRLLLDKIGVIYTLFIAPIIISIFIILTLIANLIPAALGMAFVIFSVAVLFERMLRQSINGEALNLLYAPLHPAEKEWALFQYRINIQSLCTSVIGVILFVISHTLGIYIWSIGFFVLGVSACAIATLIVVKRGYLKILISAMRKWALVKPEFAELDKESLKIIKTRLTSQSPEEIIYMLQMIENAESEEFPAILMQTLDHPHADVRYYALSKIEQYLIFSAEIKVKEICIKEKDPKVLGQALRALEAISNIEQFTLFEEYLQSPIKEVASSCLIALFLHGSETEKEKALELLYRKAKSPSEDERLTAAWVLKEVDIPDKADLLIPLLSDSNMETRLAACQAAGDVKDERLYPALIENLSLPHLNHAAFKSMLKLDPSDYIIKNFELFSHGIQIELVHLFGFIKNDQVIAFLQKFLTASDRTLYRAALRALKNQSFKAASRDQISNLLAAENRNILFIKEILGSFKSANTKLIHDLLCREIELLQENCFWMLTFIYPEAPVITAKEGLKEENRNKNSYAVEILFETLTKEDAKNLLPQLSFFPYAKPRPIEQQKSIEEGLLQTLGYAQNCYIPAINSAAIYTIGALGLKPLADIARKSEGKNDPFIDEIRPWTLKKLDLAG